MGLHGEAEVINVNDWAQPVTGPAVGPPRGCSRSAASGLAQTVVAASRTPARSIAGFTPSFLGGGIQVWALVPHAGRPVCRAGSTSPRPM